MVNINLKIAENSNKMGSIYRNQNRIEEAILHFEKSVSVLYGVEVCEENREACKILSTSYFNLEMLYYSMGKYEKTKEYSEKNRDLCEKITEKIGDIEAYRNLALCYQDLGYLHEIVGNDEEAEAFFAKKDKLHRELNVSTHRDELQFKQKMLEQCEKKKHLVGNTKKWDEWKRRHGDWRAFSFDDESYLRGTVEELRELTDDFARSGSYYESIGDIEGAVIHRYKSMRAQEKITYMTKTSDEYERLSDCYRDLGFICQRMNLHEHVMECLALTKRYHRIAYGLLEDTSKC